MPEPSPRQHSPHDALTALGWDDGFAVALDELTPGAFPARVSRVDRGGTLTVETAAGSRRARLTPHFRRAADPTVLPAVGDWTAVRAPQDGALTTVEAVLPRRGAFVRRAAGERTAPQVVAANVDVALLVSSLAGPLNPGRLERLLALAWDSGAEPVVVLAQADRCEDPSDALEATEATALAVGVHVVSAVTGEGLAELSARLRPARTGVLLGTSGAGKSTLANRLLGSDAFATASVRRDGKGRHTTSHRELVRLPSGGLLIDTPGLREVGLWGDADAGPEGFDEVDALAASCRFRDCAHDREPGCAVIAAVGDGALPAERLERYRRLQRELAHVARAQDALLRREETRRWRAISRSLRYHPKPQDR